MQLTQILTAGKKEGMALPTLPWDLTPLYQGWLRTGKLRSQKNERRVRGSLTPGGRQAVAVWRNSPVATVQPPLESSLFWGATLLYGEAEQADGRGICLEAQDSEQSAWVFYLAEVCTRRREALGVENEDSLWKSIPSPFFRAFRCEVGTRMACQKLAS